MIICKRIGINWGASLNTKVKELKEIIQSECFGSRGERSKHVKTRCGIPYVAVCLDHCGTQIFT